MLSLLTLIYNLVVFNFSFSDIDASTKIVTHASLLLHDDDRDVRRFVDIIPLNYDSCVSNESVPIIGAWMIEISLDMLMLERKFGHQEQLSTIHMLGMRNV